MHMNTARGSLLAITLCSCHSMMQCQQRGGEECDVLQLLEDVREECLRFGTLEGLCAPRPPISISDSEGSRVFVKFSTHEEAKKVKNAFNGREFDGQPITASLASEDDYNKAMQGEWTGQYAQQPMSVAIDAGAPPLPCTLCAEERPCLLLNRLCARSLAYHDCTFSLAGCMLGHGCQDETVVMQLYRTGGIMQVARPCRRASAGLQPSIPRWAVASTPTWSTPMWLQW